jgi:hypothetical protein
VRVAGRVLLGVGVFLLVLAPFMRFYAYPRLAIAPADQTLRIVATAHDANILDTKNLVNIRTGLTATRTIAGDAAAADKQGGNTDVWVMTLSTVDSKNIVRSRLIERAAFDNHTSASVQCCGQYLSTTKGVDQPVHHQGLVYKFPFDTQKHDYLFWDPTLKKATPMVYQGTTTIDGYTCYEFVQTIKPAPSAPPQKLGASFLDLPGTGKIESQQYYSNIRTVWVEPNTGVIFKGQEQQYNTIRALGKDRVITTDATVTYTPATTQMLADTFGSKGKQLHLIRTTLPLVALIAGIVVLLGGIAVLVLASRRPDADPSSGRRRSTAVATG